MAVIGTAVVVIKAESAAMSERVLVHIIVARGLHGVFLVLHGGVGSVLLDSGVGVAEVNGVRARAVGRRLIVGKRDASPLRGG